MKVIGILFLCFAMSSCATQTYNINGGGGSSPDKEVMQHFFVSGIGQAQETDAADACGGADKVAKVESQMSVLNVVLGMVTWGIYTPWQAKVYCTS